MKMSELLKLTRDYVELFDSAWNHDLEIAKKIGGDELEAMTNGIPGTDCVRCKVVSFLAVASLSEHVEQDVPLEEVAKEAVELSLHVNPKSDPGEVIEFALRMLNRERDYVEEIKEYD